ncbi:MAG: sugar-transfer associated ATP-grasp domain-containing protein [Pseudomonadota bacterium]
MHPRFNTFLPIWRLKRLWHDRAALAELARHEMESPCSKLFGLQERLDCWIHGFLSESRLIYDFENNPRRDYLTDYARYTKADINGIYTSLLSNKVMFDAIMRPFRASLPKLHAIQFGKRLIRIAPEPGPLSWHDVLQLCRSGNNLVLKPQDGGGGKGIKVITSAGGELHLNGIPLHSSAIVSELEGLKGYIVQELLEQAEYAQRIQPQTTNTIRILTMWDDKAGEPFAVAAIHRFGSIRSHPVDNWTQGGLSAAIDLQTGEMSMAVSYPSKGALEWHEKHPDTGEFIAGVKIPNWHDILRRLLDIARVYPYLRYVGWDIMLDTRNELKIIEGNHRSDVNLIQVHTPLLRDPRVREFYRQN